VNPPLLSLWLGRRSYPPLHALQQALVEDRVQGRVRDVLLLLEHHPVITFGRGASSRHLLISSEEVQRQGIQIVETGRGGDVTFHGPGQLVVYLVLDLKPDRCDVRKYVRDLSRIMEHLGQHVGLSLGTLPGLIGSWVDKQQPQHWPGETMAVEPAKIGAIGVRLSRWVTMHGFAFNASTDLTLFRSLIVPCGISTHGITSVADLGGTSPTTGDLARRIPHCVRKVWGVDCEDIRDFSTVDDNALLSEIRAIKLRLTLLATASGPLFNQTHTTTIFWGLFRRHMAVGLASWKGLS